MASAVGPALAEIDDLIVQITPQLEGLYDYRRLNLEQEAMAEIVAAITLYEARLDHLHMAKASLETLEKDGHPDFPVREISQAALADLQANKSTIAAALGRFTGIVAQNLNLSGKEKEPKHSPV